jgi:uncharacterized membrane protein
MAHCTKCGTAVADGAGFCPSCGAPVSSAAAASTSAAPVAAGTSGMQENVAGGLSYVLGWITGLIFYFIDKRPFVRFHAAQSIVLFGGFHILTIVLGLVLGVGIFVGHGAAVAGAGLAWGLISLLDLVIFVLWIVLMIMAFQGKKFRVPVVADLVDQIFKP